MTITLRDWETGDWFELYVNGEMIHAGHDLPRAVLFDLLKELGAEVFEESVPCEDEA